MEVLEAAEKWSIPPWEMEGSAPDIWMERELLWGHAKAQRRSNPKAPVGEVRQVGRKRIKRLI